MPLQSNMKQNVDTLELCNIYDYLIILPLYFYISNDLSSNAR